MGKDTTTDIQNLREDYRASKLEMEMVKNDPLDQFGIWMEAAIRAKVSEPNAMTLATATPEGIPSARTVLLKGYDKEGLVFYTNYDSRKGQEIENNPHACLVFCWLDLQRQVRINGRIERISRKDSLAYFQSRPKSSQIGAWASPQSQIIRDDRSDLETREADIKARYKDTEQLPLPPNWGGFRIIPATYEFWQGRTSRLHDRIFYQLEEKIWKRSRLAP